MRYLMNEPPYNENENEVLDYSYEDGEQEASDKTRLRKIKWIAILLIVTIVGFVVGSYFLQQYKENKRVEDALFTEEAVEYLVEEQTTYSDYLRLFESHNIKEPITSFVYNVEVPESRRKEVDPYWDDVYLGFEKNLNLSISLFELEDGNLLVIYDTDTEQVHTVTPWPDDVDQELSLEILKKKGEKAKLTKRASEAENSNEKEQLVKEIEHLNEELMDLFYELTQTLP